jgi:hypothetical protein
VYEKREKIIDYSTLVKSMRRLVPERIWRIERAFTLSLRKHKIIKGWFLFSDTTSLERNIDETQRQCEAIYEKVRTVGKGILEQTEQRLKDETVTDKIVSYYEVACELSQRESA